ncbi:MAG: hypothetical protein Q7R59_01740 [bacterium]|nr:hypothetical protein [bacterium]
MNKLALVTCGALLLAACGGTVTTQMPATVQIVKQHIEAADEGNAAGGALLGYAVDGVRGAIVGAASLSSTPRRLVGCSITAKLASKEVVHVNYVMTMIASTEQVNEIVQCVRLKVGDELVLTMSEFLGNTTYKVSSWPQ